MTVMKLNIVTEAIVIVAYFTALFKSAVGLNAQTSNLLHFKYTTHSINKVDRYIAKYSAFLLH